MKPLIKKIIAREFLVFILVLAIGLLAFLGTYPYNYYKHSQITDLDSNLAINTKLYANLIAPYNSKFSNQNSLTQSFYEDFINNKILTSDKNKDKSEYRTTMYIDLEKANNFYDIAEVVSNSKVKMINTTEIVNKFNSKYKTKFSTVDNPTERNSPTDNTFWIKLYSLANNDSIKMMWENYWQKSLIKFFKESGDTTPEMLKNYILSNTIYKNDLDNRTKALIVKENLDNYPLQKSEIESSILSFDNQLQFALQILIFSAIILFGLRYLIYGISWSLRTLKQSN